MAGEDSDFNIEERLKKHDEVLKSYRQKFEEHKQWLHTQSRPGEGDEAAGQLPSDPPPHPRAAQRHAPGAAPAAYRDPVAVTSPGSAADPRGGVQQYFHPGSDDAAGRRSPPRHPAAGAANGRGDDSQHFRPANKRTGHPLRVYDRVTQWQRRREQRLQEMRQQREMQEITPCTFNPATRSPVVTQGPMRSPRLTWEAKPGATIYGGDGKAWGYHEFVERQREARRRSKEGNDGAFCTGKGWRNEITVPQEFQLGRRDRSIKALQKPLSPPTCVPSVSEHHHLAKEVGTALPKDSPLHVLQDRQAGGLPRVGLFSERISAKIIDYAMTQPGVDSGAPDPYSYTAREDGMFTTPQQMPPQGHFSQGQGHFAGASSQGSQRRQMGYDASPQPGDEWQRRSAEKRAIEEQLYAGGGAG